VVHEDIGRLDVLVYKAALVQLAQDPRDIYGDAQERAGLHGPAHHPLERVATGVLEHESHRAALTLQRQWPRRPGVVQLASQFPFASEALETGVRRILGGERRHQHDPARPAGGETPFPAQNAVAVLSQDRGAVDLTRLGWTAMG
jgi:hypothetical protein